MLDAGRNFAYKTAAEPLQIVTVTIYHRRI